MFQLLVKHQLKDSTGSNIVATEIALLNAMGKADFELLKTENPLPMMMISDYGFTITLYTFKRKKA
jgi:hypothetical protein